MSFQAALCYSCPESLTACSQEEMVGNLLSSIEDKFSESDFLKKNFNGHLGLLCD